MSIRIEWQNEQKTIICGYFNQQWTWEDYDEALGRAFAMMHTVEHTVDVVVIQTTPMPKGNMIVHFQNAKKKRPENQGLMVMVLGNTALGLLTKSISSIVEKVAGRPADMPVFTTSLEEALEILTLHQQKRVGTA